MKNSRVLIATAAVIVLAIVAVVVHGTMRGVEVEVARAERGVLTAPLATDGVVEAIEARLAPEASGTLTDLYVDEGDSVQMGQVLALVTDEKATAVVSEAHAAYEEADANVRVAEAQLDLARSQSDADIATSAAGAGAESALLDKARKGSRKQEISQADAAVKAAQAQVEATQANVAAAESAVAEAREASAAMLQVAQAGLSASQAQYEKAKSGPRTQEIEQAQAAYDAAKAEAHNAKLHYDRTKNLHTQGVLARADLDNAEAALATANAAEKSAREALALLREGTRVEDIRSAEAELSAARGKLAEANASKQTVNVREKELAVARADLRHSKAVLEEARQYADMVREGSREEDIRAQRERVAMALAEQRRARGSRSSVTAAQHAYEVAQAAARRAKANLNQAKSHLADTVINSPVSGVVADKLMEIGEAVGPTVPVLYVVNNTDVWVTAEVDDEDISRVYDGQDIKVTCEAYPDRVFSGKVTLIGGVAMPKGTGRVKAKIVRVRIQVANAVPYLKPGMSVDIEATAQLKGDTLLVPADAVIEEGDSEYVWVIENRRASKRAVETGFSNYTQTEVVSGLSSDEVVVVSGKDNLAEGIRVAATEAVAKGTD